MSIKNFFEKVKSFFRTRIVPPTITADSPLLNIQVLANGKLIGVAQQVTISEKLNDPKLQIKTGRIRFDRARIKEAFRREFVGKNSQIVPLQINIGTDNKTTVSIHDLWIDGDVGYQYQTSNWIILDCLNLATKALI